MTNDLAALLPSWKLALHADRKSPQTIDAYTTGVRLFLRWCAEQGHAAVLDRTRCAAGSPTCWRPVRRPPPPRSRQMALKRFAAWLVEEGQTDADPLRDLAPPKLDTTVIERLTDDECAGLIKACQGKEFIDRRDEAIVRLMIETGMRAGEVARPELDDVDLARGWPSSGGARAARAGWCRSAPRWPAASTATCGCAAHTGWPTRPRCGWVVAARRSRYHGLNVTMKRRAELAGIKGFHLHLLRHTAAIRWLAAGGSENGLMAVAGWSSREMLDRYTRASASDRAAAESRSLNLGDLGV